MPDPPLLVAMCGIPFSGKSTIARELGDRCGLALVSVDAIVRERNIDVGSQRGWAKAMAEGLARTRRLLAEGQAVVYDNANHSRRNRDRCRRLVKQNDARFRLVWVDTPVEVARRRLVANRQTLARSDVPDTSFFEIVDQFEPPADERNVLRFTPGMTIDDLIRSIA